MKDKDIASDTCIEDQDLAFGIARKDHNLAMARSNFKTMIWLRAFT